MLRRNLKTPKHRSIKSPSNHKNLAPINYLTRAATRRSRGCQKDWKRAGVSSVAGVHTPRAYAGVAPEYLKSDSSFFILNYDEQQRLYFSIAPRRLKDDRTILTPKSIRTHVLYIHGASIIDESYIFICGQQQLSLCIACAWYPFDYWPKEARQIQSLTSTREYALVLNTAWRLPIGSVPVSN